MGSDSRKPPKATRVQIGKSGDPTGWTDPDLNPGEVLQSIDNEEIVRRVNGKRTRMPKAEVCFQQLFDSSIKGDLSTARLIAKMASEYFGPEAEGPPEVKWVVMPDEFFDKSRTEQGKNTSTEYRNPPKATRSKEVRSAIPRQRKVSSGYLFRKVARQRVSIKVNGKQIIMSRWQLYLRQIYTMSLNKNDGAARLLHQLRTQFPGEPLPGETITYFITEEDAKL